MNKVMGYSVGTVLVLLVGAFMADCCGGKRCHYNAVVVGHHYVPPKTDVSSDSDGKIHMTSYPEEFHLICSSDIDTFDVHSTRKDYYLITNNEPVTVITRLGKWSGINYFPRIIPSFEK